MLYYITILLDLQVLMLFIVVLTRVICTGHKDVDVVLLSVLLFAICT